MSRHGEGRSEGWPWQEGRSQEEEQGSQFDFELIYHQLLAGREALMDPACVICGKDRQAHDSPEVRHTFTPEGVRVDTSQFGPKRSERKGEGDDVPRRHSTHWGASQASGGFDPVLRQALVDKGILTPEDLMAASAKISAITGQVMRGG